MFGNISNCQVIAFGNAENGCFWHYQNADNQYRYNRKTAPNSTGKEKDPLRLYQQSGGLCRARLTSPPDLLTGYSYFGARYLEHELMTAWLSVDPMADKYPSISPYAYCAWNLVKLVDPKGEEIDNYRLDIYTGELRFYNKTDDSRDCIDLGYYSDNEWISTHASFDCAKGILVPDEKVDNSTIHLFANECEGLLFMKNVSFACHKEIAAYSYIDKFRVLLEIFPWKENEALNSKFLEPERAKRETIIYDIHTHCGTRDYENNESGTLVASYIDKNDVATNGNWRHYILSIIHGLGQFDEKGNVKINTDNITESLKRHYKGYCVEQDK